MMRVVIACILLASLQGAAAEVQVPQSVIQTSVGVVVKDVAVPDPEPKSMKLVATFGTGDTQKVHEDVIDLEKTKAGDVLTRTFIVAEVAAGLQAWTVEQVTVNATDKTETVKLGSGHVYVQDALASIMASVTALEEKVTALETAQSQTVTGSLTGLQNELKALQTSLTSTANKLTLMETNVDSLVTSAAAIQAAAEAEEPASSDSTLNTVGTGANLALAVGVLVLVAIMQWQSRKRHQEAMVFMLAMAAKMKVTPDSPEFQTAVAALE